MSEAAAARRRWTTLVLVLVVGTAACGKETRIVGDVTGRVVPARIDSVEGSVSIGETPFCHEEKVEGRPGGTQFNVALGTKDPGRFLAFTGPEGTGLVVEGTVVAGGQTYTGWFVGGPGTTPEVGSLGGYWIGLKAEIAPRMWTTVDVRPPLTACHIRVLGRPA